MRHTNFYLTFGICPASKFYLERIFGSQLFFLTCTFTVVTLITLLSSTNWIYASEITSPLNGNWHLVQTEQESKERLKAINEAIRHLKPFQQSKARGHLDERTSPPHTVSIIIKDTMVTITSEARRIKLEIGGPPIKMSGSEGKAYVSARMEGSFLVITARADNGERRTSYRVNKDLLTVEVTVTGARLAKALNYVSTYTLVQ